MAALPPELTRTGLPVPATDSDNLDTLEAACHVWLAAAASPLPAGRVAQYEALLDTVERGRYERIRFDRDRRLYLVSHALVRRVLSGYAAVDPAAWRFSATGGGRPEIAAPVLPRRLRFNLSHTDGLAACVVTLEHDCGVDVERVGARRSMAAIAARMFAAPEQRDLASLQDPAAYRERFFTYWTLREAWGKARGGGLAQLPRSAWFAPGDTADITLLGADGADAWRWHCVSLKPTADHRLAVVVRLPQQVQQPVVCRFLEP